MQRFELGAGQISVQACNRQDVYGLEKASDQLVKRLESEEIKSVFGVPGEENAGYCLYTIGLQTNNRVARTVNVRDYSIACRCASTLRASAGRL